MGRAPPWAALMDELLIHIGRVGSSAATIITMECTCVSWRTALRATETLWKMLALQHFPRLHDLLRLSPVQSVSYRTIYERQLAADFQTHDVDARASELSEYLLTIEFTLSGSVFRWTGAASAIVEGDVVLADGSTPRLWEDGESPLGDLGMDNQVVRLRESSLTVFVTHRLLTVRLYEADFDEIHDDGLDGTPLSFDWKALPRRWNITDTTDLDMHITDTGLEVPANFELVCRLNEDGRVALRFKCDEDGNDMDTDQLHAYFEQAVPWPTH